MVGWHYGVGGDLGLWLIYASWLTLILIHSQAFCVHSNTKNYSRPYIILFYTEHCTDKEYLFLHKKRTLSNDWHLNWG